MRVAEFPAKPAWESRFRGGERERERGERERERGEQRCERQREWETGEREEEAPGHAEERRRRVVAMAAIARGRLPLHASAR